MGIRGLETFLEKHCSEACRPVDIKKLIQDFREREGKDPTIVVDAQSCYKMWYQDIDWLAGFEIQEFIRRLELFVQSFKKLGVRLIFFFGGLTPHKKRQAWLLRRQVNVTDIHIMIDILKKGKPLTNPTSSIPPNMGITTSYILKYILGCEVYMSVDECDEEVIDFVQKHNCFAIFGQDSDFVVSQVNAIVLSSKNFNMQKMTTLCYDRQKLAQNLKIRCDQLPLFALLAGNDMVPFIQIKDFHQRLCDGMSRSFMVPFQILMPAIGRYINDLPKDSSIEKLLELIVVDLFGSSSVESLETLKMSYKSYFVEDRKTNAAPVSEWSRILSVAKYRHKNLLAPNILFSILSEQIFECSTVFEDLRSTQASNPLTRDQPSSTVIRPLRSRLYGVLLFDKEKLAVREWCGENVDSYMQPVIVQPVKPVVDHPGLLVLWSENNSDRVVETRWKLFLTSVCPTLKVSPWKCMDEDLLLATLSVYYLHNVGYLNNHEVDAVLATIATYPLYPHYRVHSLNYNLDFRAAHISVTLIRTYGILMTLLAACGNPIDISANNAVLKFEGKLFQKKYADLMKDKQSYRRNSLCEDDINCVRVFYRMRKLILGDEPRKKPRHPKFSTKKYDGKNESKVEHTDIGLESLE